MVSGKLLFFLVATCLAAPPKLTFPSFSSPVGELTEEDRVQEKVASLTGITKDDEEQKASLKESFLDKHEKFLGLLDFDFFSSAAKTSEFEEKVEIPQSGSGRQAQLANPMPGSSGSHMNDETSEVCRMNYRSVIYMKKSTIFSSSDYRGQNLARPLAESSTSFDTLGMVSMNSAHPMISTPS